MNISDQDLMAYADGETPEARRNEIEAAIAADPRVAARLAVHRALAARVKAAFDPVALEPAPERLIAAVSAGAVDDANVIAFPTRRSVSGRPAWLSGGAVAAGLVLGLVVGRLSGLERPAWISDDMAARGVLAQALNTQLAGAKIESAVKIGVSFRATDGSICRTFSAARGGGFDGLACRRGPGWAVKIAVPAAGAGPVADYRTAASALPTPVADLAQSLAAGPAFDSTSEAKARDEGWR